MRRVGAEAGETSQNTARRELAEATCVDTGVLRLLAVFQRVSETTARSFEALGQAVAPSQHATT